MNWVAFKGFGLLAIGLFLAAAPLSAQTPAPEPSMPDQPGGLSSMPIGSVVKGFVMPQRSALGELQSNIMGDEAHVISASRIVITNLKVDLYEAGGTKVGTVITAPRCDFWTVERRISGHDGVVIDRPDSHITADQVDWDFRTQVALLHQHVKVILLKTSISAPPSS